MSYAPRLGTRRAYSGRVINVDVDSVRFPDGTQGELEMVRHSGAAAVLPLVTSMDDPDPETLLVRQYRYAAEAYLHEIPAGRLDPGEQPTVCASRELREETGCTAERMTALTTIYTTPGFTDERIHLFLAEDLTRGEPSREPDEFMEIIIRPFSEVLRMVRRGDIIDGKSLAAILFVAQFMRERRSQGTRP